ncbi:MAG TPA: ankyrin repeat domain-containing protein [Bryobacteraceae bacterium]|nr:ankyrin repeat domain-containing protein [Bryobacteraceae bacterium]
MRAACQYSTLLLCLCVSAFAADKVEGSNTTAEEYFRAIRANDLGSLKTLCKPGVAKVRDRLDWTPLHFAALFGSAEAVRMILEAGGDPNARNKSQATPLILGAYSFEKTRLLVEKGGDVNAKAGEGSTPLWVASGAPGNEKTVRYLIEKGADVKEIRPNGSDYLIRASEYQDQAIVRLLLDQHLDPHRSNNAGSSALYSAIACDGGAKARMLISAGANVNAFTTTAGNVKNGPIDAFGLTPLMDAATCGETSTVAALIKAGANLNALDHRHMTALMMAAAVDRANPETVRVLIEAGADLNIADRNSETALDWAKKYRNPEVVALLEKAGARGKGLPPDPVRPADYKPYAREAIARASALLATSNEAFFREGGGCVGCHHQPFAGRAFAAVKEAGLPAEKRLRQVLVDGMTIELPRVMAKLPYLTAGGGGYDSFLYPLAGFADMGEPASFTTDVMVHYIAESQDPSGTWIGQGSRPPLQESSITRTMLAIYAMKHYGWAARQAEFEERIARARTWLLSASAATTVDEADRLMGLWLAGAPESDLRKVSQVLLGRQRGDGGWAQTPYLDSDAFGTAAALYSLRKTGSLKVSDTAYQRGTQYLLNTQFPDGSWYVRSRVVKLQPYFQSAFPFDHDQWISNTATAYAVMALAPVAGGR